MNHDLSNALRPEAILALWAELPESKDWDHVGYICNFRERPEVVIIGALEKDGAELFAVVDVVARRVLDEEEFPGSLLFDEGLTQHTILEDAVAEGYITPDHRKASMEKDGAERDAYLRFRVAGGISRDEVSARYETALSGLRQQLGDPLAADHNGAVDS